MNQHYFLFSGCDFYPLGGYEDFVRSFSSIDECKEYIEQTHMEAYGMSGWAHIVKDHKIILKGKVEYFFSANLSEWKWEEIKNDR